jgi:polyisoprenoid-binding protein YceI
MKLSRTALTLLVAAAVSVPAGAADTFVVDTAHTEIGFTVSHMVLSKVKGKFTDFEGTITHDPDDMTKSSVELTIQAASIDTNNDERDTHLRSPDFFDVDQNPLITFKSTEVAERGDGWVASGPFTMHGVTRQVELPFTITGIITDPWGNRRMGVEVEPFTLDRTDYGVSWSKTLDTGGLMVGHEVLVELSVQAIEKKAD